MIRFDAVLPLEDGVELVADVYLPDGVGPWPSIVERTPYGRRLARIEEFGEAVTAAGFAFVAQDVRGRGDSGGHFHMLTNVPDEGIDGEATLRWIRAQPWCNGEFATVGGSFSAANQQALALRKPGGLRTQILRDSGTNYWRRMLRFHGLFNVGMVLPWVLSQAADSQIARQDHSTRTALLQMRSDLESWLDRLPLRRGESPLARCPEYEEIYFKMLETSDDGPYWQNPTARLEGRWNEYPRDVSILLISGWFAHHCAANLDKLRELGSRSSKPVCLIVGPWIHGPHMVDRTHAGEVEFGAEAAKFAPMRSLWLDWLEQTLSCRKAMSLPRVAYFLMGTGDGHRTVEGRYFHGGAWRTSDVWPPVGTKLDQLFLQGDGRLDRCRPEQKDQYSEYVFDPNDPCPSIGGNNQQVEDLDAFILSGPWDQRCREWFAACHGKTNPLSNRNDVLCFRSDPLDDEVEVTGEPYLYLWAATDAPDTDFIVRLVDEYPASDLHPNGLALALCEGAVRLRYRDDRASEELVTPGATYALRIELSPTSNLFKRGHRIRLDVTSSAFPAYDVNPNSGEPLGRSITERVARQQVHHSRSASSYVELPVVSAPEADKTTAAMQFE